LNDCIPALLEKALWLATPPQLDNTPTKPKFCAAVASIVLKLAHRYLQRVEHRTPRANALLIQYLKASGVCV